MRARSKPFENYLKRRFNITYEDYLDMHAEQNSCCAICRIPEQHNGRNLAIDHCHTRGHVRGLLCKHCNVGLGNFNDSPRILSAAIDYVCENKYNKKRRL